MVGAMQEAVTALPEMASLQMPPVGGSQRPLTRIAEATSDHEPTKPFGRGVRYDTFFGKDK